MDTSLRLPRGTTPRLTKCRKICGLNFKGYTNMFERLCSAFMALAYPSNMVRARRAQAGVESTTLTCILSHFPGPWTILYAISKDASHGGFSRNLLICMSKMKNLLPICSLRLQTQRDIFSPRAISRLSLCGGYSRKL